GKTLLGVTGISFGLLCAATTPFLLPAFRRICLPYVPATEVQMKNIFQALSGRKGNLIDLGSGDGRIVIEAARQGFVAVGVELNPWLVAYSKFRSYLAGTSKNTKFKTSNLFKESLSKYDNIVIFGVDSLMEPLGNKLKAEVTEDSLIIACRFPFHNDNNVSKKYHSVIGNGIDTVWTYKKS
ncbi:hypothetical protein HELRODRAFT_135380, partial [Helobdella robusta]|uniref:Methyltransferase domain-containing protein n=1 Tax=Helobdella robusta TaxID=6412 RepID=T1EI84_HELRO